jgi:hypothetical protein
MMKQLLALVAVPLAFSASQTQAAVINGDNVAGYSTFVDISTGYTWLDLDSFSGQTINQMVAAASAAGFTLAKRAQVDQLLSALPLDAGQWADYQPIIGDSPTRDLYWGAYDDGGSITQYGYAFAYGDDTAWEVYDNVMGGDQLVGADMNIFAYRTADVPEPAALGLLGLGVLGIAATRRRTA